MKLLLSFVLCLFTLSSAHADTVPIYGVDFPVDRIAVSDDESAVVTIRGESRLIPRSSVDSYVIKEFFSPASTNRFKISGSQLERFIIDSFSYENYEWTGVALSTYCHDNFPQAGKRGFLEGLAARDKGFFSKIDQSLRQNLEISHFDPECTELIFISALAHPDEVRRSYLKLLYAIAPTMRELYKQRYNESLLKGEDPDVYLSSYEVLYGETDPLSDYFQSKKNSLKSLSENISQKRWFNLKKDIETFSFKDDNFLSQYLSVHAEHLCSSESLLDCISFFNCIPIDQLKPSAPEVIQRVFVRSNGSEDEIFTRKDLLPFIELMAQKSSDLKNLIIEKLSLRLRDSLSYFDFDLITLLSKLSPERARSESLLLAKNLYAINRSADAKKLLQTFVPDLTFVEKIKIHTYRLFNSLFFLLILIGLILTALGCLRYTRAKRAVPERSATATSSGAFRETPRFVSEVKVARDSPRKNEIKSCLEFFGLQEGASEKHIKNAYRKRIKDVHPDARGTAQSTGANAEFLKTQEIYERLMELLKEGD